MVIIKFSFFLFLFFFFSFSPFLFLSFFFSLPDTTLTIDSVSEYYDEHQLNITAREAQLRLIQMYPFDADNYTKSTKYVIHHVMKVLDIDQTSNKLVLCEPRLVPKEAHSPVGIGRSGSGLKEEEMGLDGELVGLLEEDIGVLKEEKVEEKVEEEEVVLKEEEGIPEEEKTQEATASPSEKQKRQYSPFWQSWVPLQLTKGAIVIQSRARGMLQREKDRVRKVSRILFILLTFDAFFTIVYFRSMVLSKLSFPLVLWESSSNRGRENTVQEFCDSHATLRRATSFRRRDQTCFRLEWWSFVSTMRSLLIGTSRILSKRSNLLRGR